MAIFILIHGAYHGAWCWDKVVSLLKKEGHRAIAIDLPGSGKDKTPISQVTLDGYAQKICKVLDTQPEAVILVGHSLGGLGITQAAEYRPDKIKVLVYLTAFLLQNGQSRLMLRDQDPESLTPNNTIYSDDKTYAVIKPEGVKANFYADCSAKDISMAKSLLCSQAIAPLATPMHITQENFGRIPRVYIQCLQDRAISPSMQKKMYTASPCQKVLSLNTSHSPFLSAPKELVAHLLTIAK